MLSHPESCGCRNKSCNKKDYAYAAEFLERCGGTDACWIIQLVASISRRIPCGRFYSQEILNHRWIQEVYCYHFLVSMTSHLGSLGVEG